MFGKSAPPTGKDPLANRIREIKERKTHDSVEPLPHKSQERAQRQPHYKQAVLILAGGQKLTVAIKNLSPTGARIETRERTLLSDEVVLTEATLNLRRRARVVWQHDGIAGLQFIEQ